MNYPIGYAALYSLGAFLALPIVALDWILNSSGQSQSSEALLWGYFIAAEYLWICALLFVADFLFRRILQKSRRAVPLKR